MTRWRLVVEAQIDDLKEVDRARHASEVSRPRGRDEADLGGRERRRRAGCRRRRLRWQRSARHGPRMDKADKRRAQQASRRVGAAPRSCRRRAYFAEDAEKSQDRSGSSSASSTRRMEWAENNYYKLLIDQQIAELVPVAAILGRLRPARRQERRSCRGNLAEASRNFTEMMFALAVLDLPFEAGEARRRSSTTAR